MNTTYDQSIRETIQLRHSVRNYEETPLTDELVQKINDFIANLSTPFSNKVTIRLVGKSNDTDSIKLGTYGVIKGASQFLVASCDKDETSLTALGYSLEKVILYCTYLGLGTVWLGGTFKKSNFAKAVDLKENQVLPIVSPVGYEGGKKSLIGSLFSKSSNLRNDFSELFFENSFEAPLTSETSGEFFEPLEMVRLAPSAMNKQPWRALKTGNTIHFYLTTTKGLSRIDLGIALCHFDLTAKELGLHGSFITEQVSNVPTDPSYTYIISWKKSNQ
ncbi:MAG: nitroreductase family protein [bacterium]|nr:nitroreductase family protein [bacterium]